MDIAEKIQGLLEKTFMHLWGIKCELLQVDNSSWQSNTVMSKAQRIPSRKRSYKSAGTNHFPHAKMDTLALDCLWGSMIVYRKTGFLYKFLAFIHFSRQLPIPEDKQVNQEKFNKVNKFYSVCIVSVFILINYQFYWVIVIKWSPMVALLLFVYSIYCTRVINIFPGDFLQSVRILDLFYFKFGHFPMQMRQSG